MIGDDASDLSRVPTPQPAKESDGRPVEAKEDAEKDAEAERGKAAPEDLDELPLEVRQKLAKLETLTSRYQGMLETRNLFPLYMIIVLNASRFTAQLPHSPRSCCGHRAFRSHSSRTHSTHLDFRPKCFIGVSHAKKFAKRHGDGRAEARKR